MNKKPLKAVGLKYSPTDHNAPRVVAKGQRKVAEQIIKIAREHNILIYEDPETAALLYKLELDQEIPEELYRAVAEILTFVYRLDREYGQALR